LQLTGIGRWRDGMAAENSHLVFIGSRDNSFTNEVTQVKTQSSCHVGCKSI
jgi:hypothetical protein